MHTPSQIWSTIQRSLFPGLREELGPLTDSEQRLAAILELVRVEPFAPTPWAWTGRPAHARARHGPGQGATLQGADHGGAREARLTRG